jgi:hypothetical protein
MPDGTTAAAAAVAAELCRNLLRDRAIINLRCRWREEYTELAG